MAGNVSKLRERNPTILGIEVWGPVGVQKILNKIGRSEDLDFEEKIGALRKILQFPGMWDAGNISKFIDVFYLIAKKCSYNSDDRITLQQVWIIFEGVRKEQLMEEVTISVEGEVARLLEPDYRPATASDRVEGHQVRV